MLLLSTLAVAGAIGSTTAHAGAPTCASYAGQGYCQYTGRVYQAYINSSGQIIFYFDTGMDPNAPASVGISGVTVFNAAMYNMADNPDYAKALYASMLSAQARGATVSVQLWGTYAGYMKLDRIWVME